MSLVFSIAGGVSMFTNIIPSSSKLYKMNFKFESQTRLRAEPSKTMNVKASLGDWVLFPLSLTCQAVHPKTKLKLKSASR